MRRNIAHETSRCISPEAIATVMECEVVIADRMSGRECDPVIAERAETAGGEFEVTKRCARLESDTAARCGEAKGEVSLEAIGGADIVLVESADLQRGVAFDRKVSRHHVRDVARFIMVEAKLEIIVGTRMMLRLFARLKNLTDDGDDVSLFMRASMFGDELR